MRNKIEYHFETDINTIASLLDSIYPKVFRTDFSEPGFVVIDFGLACSSEHLRAGMVYLKDQLSKKHAANVGKKLLYQWMGRFDQQETTKFHLDNAADQSFLMLGYEPTVIQSKLYFADYVQFAKSINASEEEYFEKYNPMFTDGEKLLKPYVTKVEGLREDTYKIVLMNNSNMNPMGETIGVFHKAEIIQKDTSKERVINSMMMYSGHLGEEETITRKTQEDFITTHLISKR